MKDTIPAKQRIFGFPRREVADAITAEAKRQRRSTCAVVTDIADGWYTKRQKRAKHQ